MKIKELLEDADDLKYDVVDDVLFFMRNNDSFYRHHYYPAINKVSDHFKRRKKIKKSIVDKLVNYAIPVYCKKYKIANEPKKIFTDEVKNSIISKILSDEKNDITSNNS